MFPLIERYLASGLTQTRFCEEEDLSMPVFTYWLQRYRRRSAVQAPSFTEITPPPSAGHPLYEIEYGGGVRLRLFAPAEAAFLLKLVKGT